MRGRSPHQPSGLRASTMPTPAMQLVIGEDTHVREEELVPEAPSAPLAAEQTASKVVRSLRRVRTDGADVVVECVDGTLRLIDAQAQMGLWEHHASAEGLSGGVMVISPDDAARFRRGQHAVVACVGPDGVRASFLCRRIART